jgi:hypothetical protein
MMGVVVSSVWARRMIAGTTLLGLMAAGMPGRADTVEVYPTEDECWNVHHVSCGHGENGWVPANETGGHGGSSGTYVSDLVLQEHMHKSMRIRTSGTE